jgi:NAD(P)-dependent dehydrogenase (short-subunit alcohol dehydrogenase family)
MSRLTGKRVVITGAGSGIGRASALLFSRAGARVFASDLNAVALKNLTDEDAAITIHPADCSIELEMEAMIASAHAHLGGLDVVFANAGISGGAVPFLEQTGEIWTKVLQTNLLGAFFAVKYGAQAMLAQGAGSIVCTASVAGMRANAAGAPYSASKAGVINLVQTAANALAGTGIRVNAVCPGLIETGMTQTLFEMARARGSEQKIGQLNPLGRAGRPDEIANAALFLASDEASYVNGQVLVVDGGLASTHPFRKGADRF